MGSNPNGLATWDDNAVMPAPYGTTLMARRTDVPHSECYVSLSHDGKELRGFVQVFPDGSAGYWKVECEQATAAPSLVEAIRKLWTVQLSAHAKGASTASAKLSVKKKDDDDDDFDA